MTGCYEILASITMQIAGGHEIRLGVESEQMDVLALAWQPLLAGRQ